ncbi:MAG: 50S ribosomal protein L24 [Candidatus Staskawiczbacteria bacterium]|nr:50S ribosomal protein L24 [Candidatus Staskawiczbacteria bacterium]
MKIKKGDNVLVQSGKDRGKSGKVLRVLVKRNRILVEGVNFRKKHVRPKKSGEKGQIVDVLSALDISSVKIICPRCGKAARVGYKIENEKKLRVCKKCGQQI